MTRELTIEEQEELQQNLNMRKALSEEILSYSSHIGRLEYAKDKLRKRFFEILEDTKKDS